MRHILRHENENAHRRPNALVDPLREARGCIVGVVAGTAVFALVAAVIWAIGG